MDFAPKYVVKPIGQVVVLTVKAAGRTSLVALICLEIKGTLLKMDDVF